MKKNYLKAIVFSVILWNFSLVTAQNMTLDWAKAMGGTGSDAGDSITTDASGNSYTTGSFNGTVDFDPSTGTYNLTSGGDMDIFIQKLDSNGNFVWAKAIGGTNIDRGLSINIATSGNIFITGFFEGTVDFDPSASIYNLTVSSGGRDIFVLKLDADGNFLWAKAMGGTSYALGASISTDASGNSYTTGDFWQTVDFDPSANTYNLTAAGGRDIFVLKLDTNGNFVWAKVMGGTLLDDGWSISTDANGNSYTTGEFGGTVDFDPSANTYNLTSAGDADIFIQKLDADGNLLWAKAMGGTDYDYGYSISIDSSGNIYTTGSFRGTADFDPSADTFELTSAGNADIFIQKLDVDGNLLWAKAMGGTSFDVGHSISTDATGNSYTTGEFYGTADFDSSANTYNLTSAGDSDIFIQKLDADGNFVWAKAIGGTDLDRGFSINADTSGNIYLTGHFGETVDFDSSANTYNLTSAGDSDIFVAKYSQTNLGISDFIENGISIYPNPTSGKLTINNEQGIINNLQISESTGKRIQSFSNVQLKQYATFEIDLSEFNKGLYFLQIQTDKGIQSTKIIKE